MHVKPWHKFQRLASVAPEANGRVHSIWELFSDKCERLNKPKAFAEHAVCQIAWSYCPLHPPPVSLLQIAHVSASAETLDRPSELQAQFNPAIEQRMKAFQAASGT